MNEESAVDADFMQEQMIMDNGSDPKRRPCIRMFRDAFLGESLSEC